MNTIKMKRQLSFVLLMFLVYVEIGCIFGSPVKRSTSHPGKKVVKFGDQLFLVDKDTEIIDDDEDHQGQHKVNKRSSEGFAHEDIIRHFDHGVESRDHQIHRRAAIKNEAYRWQYKTIPYSFDRTFGTKDRKIVIAAMDEWARHTCLKFRPARRSDANKMKFIQGDGCSSFVGMVDEGTQEISLDSDGCRLVSTALHEIGHALGMYHTQVRPDRDRYIKVDLSDVDNDLHDNFIKQTWETAHHYGVNYDFNSIMHYDGTSFTSNGGTSIKTLDPKWQKIIGSAEHLSFGDIEMMNKMYHCVPASCRLKDSDCPGTSYVGMNCKCMCPGPSDVNPVVLCSNKNTRVIESEDGKQSGKNSLGSGRGSGSGSGGKSESGSGTTDEWDDEDGGNGKTMIWNGNDWHEEEGGDNDGRDVVWNMDDIDWEDIGDGDDEWEYYK